MERLYLDNNATTRVAGEVLQAMIPFYTDLYGNASSVHWFGQEAKNAIDGARLQMANMVRAEPNEVIFTSGGTESDNLAIRGIVDASSALEKHVITSQIEHHAVLHTCEALQKQGVCVTYVPVDSRGMVDPADVKKAILPSTILISIMHANNEVGTIQPIREIGEIAQEHDIYFHTDAVQTAGKLPIDVNELGVDMLSVAGHKFHGPKGIGVLYVRKGTRIRPLLYGGAHERNRRAGTENVAEIVGLGKAAVLAVSELEHRSREIAELRDYFEKQVFRSVPETHLNGAPNGRICNTSNLRFEQVESEGMVINLDLAGVACSTGSACASGSIEPSHVLMAMGLPMAEAFGSVRFSLSRYTTRDEIDQVLGLLPAIVERLRRVAVKG
jgi:cysteine desulfurase